MVSVSRGTIVVAGTLVVLAGAFVALPLVTAHGNQVDADSQLSTDGTVYVESAFVVTDAWLVIHSDDDGSVGEPIGRTDLNATTVRSDIPVEIDDEVWSDWGDARRVHVVLHSDDGDGTFEPDEDPPLTRDGAPIAATIVVGNADAAAYVGVQGFHPHETSGNLTVRQVTLPVDGFLVVHNGSPTGTVVGHTTLAAGTSENVTVRLNTTFLRTLGSEADLTAVLYRDDGDRQFDPASDSVVQAGTEPVASTVAVHVNVSALQASSTETEHGDEQEQTTSDHSEHTHNDSEDDHHDEQTTTSSTVVTDPPVGTTTSNATGTGFGIVTAVLAVILTLALRRY